MALTSASLPRANVHHSEMSKVSVLSSKARASASKFTAARCNCSLRLLDKAIHSSGNCIRVAMNPAIERLKSV